jgi:chondroitin 4-sulfotransferase 11
MSLSRLYSLFPKQMRKKIFYLKDLLLHGEIEPREFLVLDNKNCAFLVLSKNACTSIKITIGKTYGIKTDDALAIHGLFHQSSQHSTLKNAERYFKFAFVRNPYSRLVSCYIDKAVSKAAYFDGYIFRLPRNMTFAEFVTKIVKIPDCLADRHFKSQYSVLYRRGKLLVDYIGKVENIEQDWMRVAEKFGFEPRVVRENTSTPKDKKRDYRLFYTQELADMVYQRYQNDFELLGYQTAHQELLDFLTKI